MKVGMAMHYEHGVTTYFCAPCNPNHGRGYTLSDLQRMGAEMREGWDQMRRDHQLWCMEQMGPDVYFHMIGHRGPPPEEPR
ncbi:hypothetical protein [Mycobacteroides franklinii]|uniref:hypothetical protein n=1 Tax=Mycobacteroides franklinii TaxID=948102 RepID=UPI001E61BDB9|nr:hypothetical protein [Mycobacteroides franklinii]